MVVFVEKLRYQVITGVARKERSESICSGDNFLVSDFAGGNKIAIVSDGMGSGALAYQQSKVTLELTEKLLESGVPIKETLELLNTTMVEEEKEVNFATMDLCQVNGYLGEVELYKAGAAATYVISRSECNCYEASSLPVGVFSDLTWNHYKFTMKEDGYIIMLTDGVMETISKEKRASFIQEIIGKSNSRNPNELAKHILQKSIELEEGQVKDDMTVIVLGVWSCNFEEKYI